MKALLFPGQGSQVVGMGSDFYKNFSIVKEIFSKAECLQNHVNIVNLCAALTSGKCP